MNFFEASDETEKKKKDNAGKDGNKKEAKKKKHVSLSVNAPAEIAWCMWRLLVLVFYYETVLLCTI